MPDLLELATQRRRLESELDELRHQLGADEERLMALRAGQRRGQVTSQAIEQEEGALLELRREIQRRKIAVADIAERMAVVEAAAQEDRHRQLYQTNDAMVDELGLIRRELLKSLAGMADLVRRHQRVAAEKVRLSAELAKINGRDYAYENYISCAILHNKDYTGDVQFVVDTLKKSRPVS